MNGTIEGADGQHGQSRQLRPLTVHEALQYSPFTSIIPFDPSILPLPQVKLPRYSGSSGKEQDENSTIYRLNKLLAQNVAVSKEAQQALAQLKTAFEDQSAQQYHMKTLKTISPANGTANSQSKDALANLSPLARVVLDTLPVNHTYPAPTKSLSQNRSEHKSTPTKSVGSLPTTAPLSSSQQRTAVIDGSPGVYLSLPDIPADANRYEIIVQKPTVLIPPFAETSLHDSSQTGVIEDASMPSATKKRKRTSPDVSGEDTKEYAVASQALTELDALLRQIHIHVTTANGSEVAANGISDILDIVQDGESVATTLTAEGQAVIESLLSRASKNGRLSELDTQLLLTLERICEPKVKQSREDDVTISEDAHEWSDDDTSSWLSRLDDAEMAFQSAWIIIKIMASCSKNATLCPEETLQAVIDYVCKVLDTLVIPIAESRSSGDKSSTFEFASAHKIRVERILRSCDKLMKALRALLDASTLPEQAISALEYMLNRMMFVENASSEKESIFGVSKFENFRKQCMRAIATLYAKYTSQRRFIVEELLTSWQRLPTTRQHARQYRLEDGTKLQMCTVLLVKILQTNALSQGEEPHSLSRAIQDKRSKRSKRRRHSEEDSSEDASEPSGDDEEDEEDAGADNHADRTNGDSRQSQIENAQSRSRAVWSASQRIVNYLVSRASTASKTGEQPHRHLLDMFVEDIVVMSQDPQWPGAEVFVRTVLAKMNEIFLSEKSAVPAKNMALETLCTIAASMIDINKRIQSAKQTLEGDQGATAQFLVQKCHDLHQDRPDREELVRPDGHYRIILESLQSDGQPVDNTVLALYIVLWIASMTQKFDQQEDAESLDKKQAQLTAQLSRMLAEERFDFDRPMDSVSETECDLAWHLMIMTSGYGVSFKHIFSVFLSSITSDQIMVRTKAIKCVSTLLDKDPALLVDQPQVLTLIVRCASDASSMVRDNALTLVGKCLSMNTGNRDQVLRPVLAAANDSTTGIRKRALKMLRDMYVLERDEGDARTAFLSSIAGAIFSRIKDIEESVSELAQQLFEELWLAPLFKTSSKQSSAAESRIIVKQQTKLIIECTKADTSVSDNLEILLRQAMSAQNKNSDQNFDACEALVSASFDAIIDLAEIPGLTSQYDILLVLSMMAKAKPQLLKQEQLEYLKPYVSSLARPEDLNLFRLVVVILRHVLPSLSAWQADFLRKVQADLVSNITKLPKLELSESVSCLWTLSTSLQDPSKLATVTISVLQKLSNLESRTFDASSHKEIEQCQRLLLLAGNLCRFCNFEPVKDKFVNALKWSSTTSVPASAAASIKSFAMKQQPPELRTVAVEALGMICQAWPKNYNGIAIAKLFQDILINGRDELQAVVLASFRDFYVSHGSGPTSKSEDATSPQKQDGIKGSLVASDNDEAAALIAQTFLGSITQIALHSLERNALLATEIIANIAKQGLVHPKQCGPALIALSTSPQEAIARIAAEQHRTLHQQHESMLEGEYMRAIQEAFKYQRDVVQDAHGFVSPSLRAKLQSMLDTIKLSKGKDQLKFMTNFCNKIDFDPATVEIQSHLAFARFCLENLICFEYGRNEDIAHLMMCAERIVIKTGAIVSHSIVTEIFKQVVDVETGIPSTQETENIDLADIDSERLLQLTTAAVILTMFWETCTFLRKGYGLAANNSSSKQKGNKDMSKAPVRTNNFNPQRQLQQFESLTSSLASRERQLARAQAFVDLLTIDNEFKVATNEGDGDGDERMMTPDGDDNEDRISAIPPSGGSRASQKRGSLGQDFRNSPAKRGRGRPRLSRVTSTGSMDD